MIGRRRCTSGPSPPTPTTGSNRSGRLGVARAGAADGACRTWPYTPGPPSAIRSRRAVSVRASSSSVTAMAALICRGRQRARELQGLLHRRGACQQARRRARLRPAGGARGPGAQDPHDRLVAAGDVALVEDSSAAAVSAVSSRRYAEGVRPKVRRKAVLKALTSRKPASVAMRDDVVGLAQGAGDDDEQLQGRVPVVVVGADRVDVLAGAQAAGGRLVDAVELVRAGLRRLPCRPRWPPWLGRPPRLGRFRRPRRPPRFHRPPRPRIAFHRIMVGGGSRGGRGALLLRGVGGRGPGLDALSA